MKKLFTKIGQRVRNKSKQILAMLLCVTMLTPMAARAIITDGIYQAPEVARTWDENHLKTYFLKSLHFGNFKNSVLKWVTKME